MEPNRPDDDPGLQRAVEALRRRHRLPLGRLPDEIINVAGDAPEDDIAVRAVAVDPIVAAPAD